MKVMYIRCAINIVEIELMNFKLRNIYHIKQIKMCQKLYHVILFVIQKNNMNNISKVVKTRLEQMNTLLKNLSAMVPVRQEVCFLNTQKEDTCYFEDRVENTHIVCKIIVLIRIIYRRI